MNFKKVTNELNGARNAGRIVKGEEVDLEDAALQLVRNVMENDREGIDAMTVEMAEDILGWMRGDDEDHKIPDGITAEMFTRIWNKNK